MRKGKGTAEPEPRAPVAKVSVRELRQNLRLFISGDRPARVVNHRRNVCIILPCGTSDWYDRWDWAKQRRTLKAHFDAALKDLPED